MPNYIITQEQYHFITDALAHGVAHFNSESGRYGRLTVHQDNVRQKLCNALGVLTGNVAAGNLQRTDETLAAMRLLGQVALQPVKE